MSSTSNAVSAEASSDSEEELVAKAKDKDKSSGTGIENAAAGSFYQGGASGGRSPGMDFSGRVVEQRVGKPQRRGLLLAHFAFKGLGTTLYLLANLVGLSYIATFVFVVLLLSVDFWLVKNLSGRLLAGLRWWSVTDHGTGRMVWRFEAWSREERQVAYQSQVSLFWAGILAQQVLWTVLLLSAVFQLKLGWLIITVIAFLLNGANLYGYVRCRLQRTDDDGYGSAAAQAGMFKRLAEGLAGLFVRSGGAYTRGQQQQQQSEYSGISGGGGAAP